MHRQTHTHMTPFYVLGRWWAADERCSEAVSGREGCYCHLADFDSQQLVFWCSPHLRAFSAPFDMVIQYLRTNSLLQAASQLGPSAVYCFGANGTWMQTCAIRWLPISSSSSSCVLENQAKAPAVIAVCCSRNIAVCLPSGTKLALYSLYGNGGVSLAKKSIFIANYLQKFCPLYLLLGKRHLWVPTLLKR